MKRALALVLLLAGSAAQAHAGHDHGDAAWTFDPWITVPMLMSALLYVIGAVRLWQRADRGRPRIRREAGLFAAGWLLLAFALVSPLHEAGERSFTLHMIEHEIIMLPATLLLVLAAPGPAFLWALPVPLRQSVGRLAAGVGSTRFWRVISHPVGATVLQAIALVFWHVPALFDRALGDDNWHVWQHISFFLTALLFWWAMVQHHSGRYAHGLAALCLFLTSLVGGLLGAVMSLASSPWYAGYAAMGMTPTGLSPVEDQQLAGLIMWIPGGLFHAGAAIYFVYQWLRSSERYDAFATQ